MKNILNLFFAISFFPFCFCNKIDANSSQNFKIKKEKIIGSIQKGPFLNGTTISIFELDKSLVQTGKIFNTSIKDNKGNFSIENIELSSNYVLLNSNGFYFDEVQGKVSSSQITLSGISDISDNSTINLNILTHLERKRVEYLYKTGTSFKDAKKKAQSEIYSIFGFETSSYLVSEKLDISSTGEENGKLLAISLIIQGKNDVGNLSELLATISTDLEEDGKISNNNLFQILNSNAKTLDLNQIRLNLEKRFQELNIDAKVPEFEKYIKIFLLRTASAPSIKLNEPTKITSNSAILNFSINPNGDQTIVNIEYGFTNSYGYEIKAIDSALSGDVSMSFSVQLKNLDSLKTYHYRIKAQNSKGVAYSNDSTFYTFLNLPVLSTLSVIDITDISAISGGTIIKNNGINSTPIISSGIVYGKNINPHIGLDTKTTDGSTNGSFQSKIEGLIPSTEYYVRSYATNLSGTSYGNEIKFMTDKGLYKIGSGVSDIDGNNYKTIIIGNFEWMSENLRTTKFSNGDTIAKIFDTKIWYQTKQGAYTYYNNNESLDQKFGKLYNFYVVNDSRGVCPSGWNVPSFYDINEGYGFLISFLGGQQIAGGKMKLSGIDYWRSPNIKATNQSGFSAMPGGYIWPDKLNENAQFGFFGQVAIFWTSTSNNGIATSVGLDQLNSQANDGIREFNWGHSIRCVKKIN